MLHGALQCRFGSSCSSFRAIPLLSVGFSAATSRHEQYCLSMRGNVGGKCLNLACWSWDFCFSHVISSNFLATRQTAC